nr:AAA family ATPase [uncultured Devosia sp.]
MDDEDIEAIEFPVDEDGLDSGADALRYLPDAMLESVLGPQGIHEISTRPGLCLLVQAPSPDFVAPLAKSIRRIGSWAHHISKSAVKRTKTEETSERLVEALSGGNRVFGISHRPKELLPQSLLTAADMTVVVPMASPTLLAKVIKAVTGDLPIDVPATLGRGLDFDELVSCIRKGSTAAECISRIRKAMEAKTRVDGFGDDVPLVKDLSGMGQAKIWAEELVEDVDAWRRGEIKFNEIGSAAAVIAGPPGTGKTALMRSIAKSTGLPLITTSVGDWFSSSPGYLDSVIKKIDETFATARAIAPSIIFLDELDAVPSREGLSSRNADWWTPVITHLLTTLDGAVSGQNEELVLVAATNHASRLDPALVRPGRFSKIIEVEPPDAQGMAGILRQHLSRDLEGEDLLGVARLANRATGAQAVAWVRSARRAARLAKRPMELSDLADVIAPPDVRPVHLLWRTAVHESGHAIAARILGVGEVAEISIVGSDGIGGYTRLDPLGPMTTRGDVENGVVQTLAGRAAEEVVFGEASTGAGGAPHSDLGKATRMIGLLHLGTGLGTDLIYRGGPEEVPLVLAASPKLSAAVEADLKALYARAVAIVNRERQALERIATDLMERRHIDGRRFAELFGIGKINANGGGNWTNDF